VLIGVRSRMNPFGANPKPRSVDHQPALATRYRVGERCSAGERSAITDCDRFARLGLNGGSDGRPPAVFGRFEATEFGALWTGDGLHGPVVAGRKAVLCAFIDDWSRAGPGWRWGHAEDTVRLEAALRRGLESGWRVSCGARGRHRLRRRGPGQRVALRFLPARVGRSEAPRPALCGPGRRRRARSVLAEP